MTPLSDSPATVCWKFRQFLLFFSTILHCRGEVGGYWLLIANNDTTCSRLLTAEPGEDDNEETETHEDNIVAGLSDVWTDFNI